MVQGHLTIDVRDATHADVQLIQAIAHNTWPFAYGSILSKDQLHYMLGRMYSVPALLNDLASGRRFKIASIGPEAVGFAGFEHHYHGHAITRLHKLYVLPKYHLQGVGSSLMKAVVGASLEALDKSIELNVNRFNAAKETYLRWGFRVVRNEVIDIGQGYVMDDHVMELALGRGSQ